MTKHRVFLLALTIDGCMLPTLQVPYVSSYEELNKCLLECGEAIACVYFTATWCSPCQRIAPVLDRLCSKFPDVLFLKVDVDDEPVRQEFGHLHHISLKMKPPCII